MNELKEFRTTIEARLADELSNSKINVQMTRITEKRGIFVYEVRAFIDNQAFRGVGESAGKAVDSLLHELKYGKAYHESHERVVL
jgi:hypothetical protein